MPELTSVVGFDQCFLLSRSQDQGDPWNIDPLKNVPFKRARSRVEKGPFQGSP